MLQIWVVEVPSLYRDDLASPYDGFTTLELLEGDVYTRLPQCPQRILHPLGPYHFLDVAQLTIGQFQQRQIGAARMSEDTSLDQAQEVSFPLCQASPHGCSGLLEGDRFAEETPQSKDEAPIHLHVSQESHRWAPLPGNEILTPVYQLRPGAG